MPQLCMIHALFYLQNTTTLPSLLLSIHQIRCSPNSSRTPLQPENQARPTSPKVRQSRWVNTERQSSNVFPATWDVNRRSCHPFSERRRRRGSEKASTTQRPPILSSLRTSLGPCVCLRRAGVWPFVVCLWGSPGSPTKHTHACQICDFLWRHLFVLAAACLGSINNTMDTLSLIFLHLKGDHLT